MKKIAVFMTVAALAFTLAGCSSNDAESADQAATDAEATETAEEPTETVVQGEIAWSEAEDQAAASESAGFSGDFVVPDPLPIGDYEWSAPNFTAMDGVAQADYDGGGIAVSIRKGEGVALEDLSADLNEYQFDWTQDVDGVEVACHGYEEGIANFLEWETEDCSYNVWCVSTAEGNLGMNEDEVAAMVAGIE
ncbi:Uncharacterised protein [Slackia heliotrinireducens]|uniref:DUF4367 domain-containing protein n=1 Tax=Slackia heliotrinireducens (strain ATCC 29202 / DSM 20476 / NCTC 11029 / RHS 1) TaxID=471855 RepID=C7N5K0_SLAHD|nr:hypothetical protein [Slackia heliotrinireducens]ACV22185.1 hypothetical protein Shel_11510 [Slackia heliotrinireducens DSM 20476]VEH00274.1 Uncharacterised protein [Slackia heliotrinireducens]